MERDATEMAENEREMRVTGHPGLLFRFRNADLGFSRTLSPSLPGLLAFPVSGN